jgi:beta-glucanase (GH16 family)
MMPTDSVYGVWPRSGEIDIMESRGNEPGGFYDGRDVFTSTFHWGPNFALDASWREFYKAQVWRTDFSKAFHTYT